MGIIKRQGIKQGIISYVAVVIGFVSTIWIYSLDEYIYGVARFLLAGASFVGAFAFLGVNYWAIRFFPTFRNEKNGHNGLFPLILSAAILAYCIFLGFIYWFRDSFLEVLDFFDMKPDLFQENFLYIALLCFLITMASTISHFISNFQRIVVPELLTNLLLKVSLPILVLLYFYGFLYEKGFIQAFIWVHVAVLIGLFIYLIYLKEMSFKINFSFLKKSLLKDMGSYAGYNILGAIGSQLATRLDLLMISSLLALSSTGVYGIALNIASVIEVPYRAFNKIASPIIARENEEKNFDEVLDIYQRSSIALLIAGLLIFMAVWISVDQLAFLAKNKETIQAGKYVIFYLGLAKIIDMATGINGQIIAYSKYYRFNVIAISILAILNVFANYYLIPIYGITGAAMATLISLGTFNVFKFIFVWIVFKMQPFTWSALWALILAAICFGLASLIPLTNIPLLNIAIKSGAFALAFTAGTLYLNLSSDLTNLFEETLKKLRVLLGFPN